MKYICNLVIILLVVTAPTLSMAEIAIGSIVTIKPGNSDSAAEQLIKKAQEMEGYFTSRSSEFVALKVPNRYAGKLQKFIESNWRVYQQDYQAENLTSKIIDVRSKLKAKEELVDEYNKILDSAAVDKIVKVAAAVANIVEEIELLRGKLRLLQHQTTFASVTVNFKLERDGYDRENITSSFQWLNTLGIENMLREFAR